VLEQTGLAPGVHYLRIKDTGQKHVSSSGTHVNIEAINYRKHGLIENIREESNNSLLWSSIVGGAVNG
jgi:hypothetical protein